MTLKKWPSAATNDTASQRSIVGVFRCLPLDCGPPRDAGTKDSIMQCPPQRTTETSPDHFVLSSKRTNHLLFCPPSESSHLQDAALCDQILSDTSKYSRNCGAVSSGTDLHFNEGEQHRV